MNTNNRPIGVFDSGVGGLSVAKAIIEQMPNESIVYFGDTLRAPYGTRTKEVITQFTLEIVAFLKEQQCKALVVACNTICVSCLTEIEKAAGIPVIEVITASVNEAAQSKKGVGIFATNATINSEEHKKKIQMKNPSLPVYGKACPLFVPIVEEGHADTEVAEAAAKLYLKAFDGKEIDSLILGCTHYPLMKAAIQKAAGSGVNIIDPALGTANELQQVLKANNALNDGEKPAQHIFYYSGDSEKFEFILEKVLGDGFQSEQHVL